MEKFDKYSPKEKMAEKFGRLLRKYRKERGLSQWDLYGQLEDYGYLGLRGGSIVSKWETGKRTPPYETILALETILQVPEGLLTSAAGYRRPKPSPTGNSLAVERQRPEAEEGRATLQVWPGRHQERLLDLVKRWREELDTPLFGFRALYLGGPGMHQDEDGFTWENTPEGVRRRLPLTVDTDAEESLLWECLRQHLQTGGYTWLLEKFNEWERVGGQELQSRAALLKKVNDMLNEKLTSVPEAQMEAAPFFRVTLVASVIDGLSLNYSLLGEPGVPLYTSYYGDFEIGSATSWKSAEAFESYHKALMATLDKHPLTESTRELRTKREDISSAIEKGLCELMVRGYVPGRCSQCPQDS